MHRHKYGNVPKRLGSYNGNEENGQLASINGNVPKRLGSYNVCTALSLKVRPMVMFLRD